MSEHTYQWRGRKLGNVDPQVAGETLERIEARDGSIKPKAVVDEARPKSSPIHPCFEWRDKVAAEEHRKWQARQLVRSVRVVTTSETGESKTEPAYHHVPAVRVLENEQPERSGYVSTARILTDADLYERAMTEAFSKLESAKHSVEELKRIAEGSGHADHLAALSIVAQSLATASATLRHIH